MFIYILMLLRVSLAVDDRDDVQRCTTCGYQRFVMICMAFDQKDCGSPETG